MLSQIRSISALVGAVAARAMERRYSDSLAALPIEDMEPRRIDGKRQALARLGARRAGQPRQQQRAVAESAMDDGVGAEHLRALRGDGERRNAPIARQVPRPDAERQGPARPQ